VKGFKIFVVMLSSISINAACAFYVMIYYDYFDFLIPDPNSFSPYQPPSLLLQWIMFLRGTIFALIGCISVVFLLLLVLARKSETVLHLKRRLMASVFFVLVAAILLSTVIKNPLRYVGCCGDGPITYWGYPYAWIVCSSESFCELRRFEWFGLFANLLYVSNLTLIAAGSIVLFKKDVTPQVNSTV
jgi:hypothetical protein